MSKIPSLYSGFVNKNVRATLRADPALAAVPLNTRMDSSQFVPFLLNQFTPIPRRNTSSIKPQSQLPFLRLDFINGQVLIV
jgi:hypothetical protein